MVGSFWNICDLLAFAPPLLEATLRQFTPFTLGHIDLRWFKILRRWGGWQPGLAQGCGGWGAGLPGCSQA